MSDPLLAGEQSQAEQIDSIGSDVVYVSETGDRTEAKAFIGSTEFEEGEIGGVAVSMTIVKSVDFLVTVAGLPNGLTDKSARGYTIEFYGGVYRLTSFNREPPIRDSGRFGLMKRIHTKRVGDV